MKNILHILKQLAKSKVHPQLPEDTILLWNSTKWYIVGMNAYTYNTLKYIKILTLSLFNDYNIVNFASAHCTEVVR